MVSIARAARGSGAPSPKEWRNGRTEERTGLQKKSQVKAAAAAAAESTWRGEREGENERVKESGAE